MLSKLYACLFALSIVLINPWGTDPDPFGTSRAEIWTQPKIATVAVIVFLNLVILSTYLWQRKLYFPSLRWKIAAGLWLIYLISSTTSTLLSPFPLHSFFGKTITSDGLLYWILIGLFVLSNALVLQIEPDLFYAQLKGLLFGGSVLALSIFPQLADWRIDYTLNSGQVSNLHPQLLESGVWRHQMPIGLYSNRGYTAFVLAGITCLSLVSTLNQCIKPNLGKTLCVFSIIALLFTQNRSGMLALVAGILYILLTSLKGTKPFRYVGIFLLISLTLFIGYGSYRAFTTFSIDQIGNLSNYEILEGSLTGRIYLWILSLKGIAERPFWGWGFNGFGIAHIFVVDWAGELRSYIEQPVISEILKLNEFTFEYFGPDRRLYIGNIIAHKAHNLFFDVALSVGIIGLICYCLLFSFCFWCTANSPMRSLEVVAISYLIFTMTWFESGQYSHLAWWSISLGLSSVRSFNIRTSEEP